MEQYKRLFKEDKDPWSYGSKEFVETIKEFEKFAKNASFIRSSLERESPEETQIHSKRGHLFIYTNGNTNNFFMAFLNGAQFGNKFL